MYLVADNMLLRAYRLRLGVVRLLLVDWLSVWLVLLLGVAKFNVVRRGALPQCSDDEEYEVDDG